MSKELVDQAVEEALGGDVYTEKGKAQVSEYMKKLGNEYSTENHISAIRDSFGTALFNLNVEHQVRSRVSALQHAKAANKDAPPAPGTSPVKSEKSVQKPVLGKDEKLGSILGDTEGGINAMQKEAFAKDGNQVRGGGTSVGTTRSDVAAATNTGSNVAAGPGAGNL